mmetsp:Transcript_18994/g.45867  ORF Transcript_18994/g.45867 Transcript_18994/m.45867 type:complete len:219 (+) Transcript_18994:235-891(+)
MTCSSCIHLVPASVTRVSTACAGPICPSTVSHVSSLVMNSQSPSVAMTRNLSSLESKSNSENSGSDDTPAECATTSPRDRDMASPGTSIWPSQTRGGPSIPSSYSTAKTRPPQAKIRSFSLGESGLWSYVMSTGTIRPSCSLPKMTRESPMLTPVRWLPRMIAIDNVVPLNSVSIRKLRNKSRSTFAIASAAAVLRLVLHDGWLNISDTSWSRNHAET